MSEENNDGTWSGLVKTAVATGGTLIVGAGTWVASHIFGGEKEAESAQPSAVSAPAPVINITTNNSQQQAGGGGTRVIERVVEKPAKPKAKTEKEALKEEPKW